MADKYRLQYFWPHKTDLLAIQWACGKDRTSGDCLVRAIQDTTDVDDHNRSNNQMYLYSVPMSLEEARDFVARNHVMLEQVYDCLGLTLEDACNQEVRFDSPVEIRNIRER